MWRRVDLVWTEVLEDDGDNKFLRNVGSHKIYTKSNTEISFQLKMNSACAYLKFNPELRRYFCSYCFDLSYGFR
jgi:hypothetical protein